MEKENICVVIPTKDRPMQYWACVESLIKNIPDIRINDIYTLEKSSSSEISKQYGETYKYFKLDNIIQEQNFHDDLTSTLEKLALRYEFVLFLTDDTIVYRKVSSICHFALLTFLLQKPEVFCCSLRLGSNTTVQDIDNPSLKLEVPLDTVREFVFPIWDWTKQPQDRNVGYPISMDGHIYRVNDILSFSQKIEFKNLREWEGNLIGNIFAGSWELPKFMYCPMYSICVNTPLNLTQYPFHKTVGPFGMSIAYLSNLFGNGQRIDLEESFKDVPIKGSHSYINFVFKRLPENIRSSL